MTRTCESEYAAGLVDGVLDGRRAMARDWLERLLGDLSDRQVDLEEVLARIIDETTRRLRADRGTLYLADHATRELVSRVAHLPEIAEIRLRIGEGFAGWVAQNAKPLRVAADTADDRHAEKIDRITGYSTQSMLAVPLLRTGVVVGVLQLLNHRDGAFTDADELALVRIAEQVVAILDRTSLRSQLQQDSPRPLAFRFNHIVGESARMQQVYALVERAARTEVTVLVRGETGTGKGLIARALHHNSPRRDAPLIKVDCAALPETLVENELFGHERGAYTGAEGRKEGMVHAAAGGTLFLDEIGELSLPMQGKLLRLLQDKQFVRVGSSKPETADVRFVAATHVDLEARVREGRFRQDLYYRLRVVEIDMPPLRLRGHGDLDRLVDHFLFELGARYGRQGITLTQQARSRLHGWSWPGNVRELEHCLESAVVLAPADCIEADQLKLDSQRSSAHAFETGLRPLDDVTRDYLKWALEQLEGNKTLTATTLGIGRNTLLRRLTE